MTRCTRTLQPRHHLVTGPDEDGSTSIQMLLVMPALFAVMFLGLQGALVYHARTVAIAGAQEGARAAGAENGTTRAGADTARAFITAVGDDALNTASIKATRTATKATVTVTGRALSVIPGWSPTVTQSASVPVERIT